MKQNLLIRVGAESTLRLRAAIAKATFVNFMDTSLVLPSGNWAADQAVGNREWGDYEALWMVGLSFILEEAFMLLSLDTVG